MLTATAYMLPNDEVECDRLILQHDVLKKLRDNRIYFAPLKDPKCILDIGTGVGIWAVEMGKPCFDITL